MVEKLDWRSVTFWAPDEIASFTEVETPETASAVFEMSEEAVSSRSTVACCSSTCAWSVATSASNSVFLSSGMRGSSAWRSVTILSFSSTMPWAVARAPSTVPWTSPTLPDILPIAAFASPETPVMRVVALASDEVTLDESEAESWRAV